MIGDPEEGPAWGVWDMRDRNEVVGVSIATAWGHDTPHVNFGHLLNTSQSYRWTSFWTSWISLTSTPVVSPTIEPSEPCTEVT